MIVRFLTKDEKMVEWDREEVMISNLVKTTLECDEEDETVTTMPLPNVKEHELRRILEFCHYYKKNGMKSLPRPLLSSQLSDMVDPWYDRFIQSTSDEASLYELTLAINYMDIPPLHDLACARIACLIRGKQPDEVRKFLGLPPEPESMTASNASTI